MVTKWSFGCEKRQRGEFMAGTTDRERNAVVAVSKRDRRTTADLPEETASHGLIRVHIIIILSY